MLQREEVHSPSVHTFEFPKRLSKNGCNPPTAYMVQLSSEEEGWE